MHAVVGVREIDPSMREAQHEALEHIVPGVAALPGTVKGYCSDREGPGMSHTYVVLATREAASAFADDVNVDLVEVRATT